MRADGHSSPTASWRSDNAICRRMAMPKNMKAPTASELIRRPRVRGRYRPTHPALCKSTAALPSRGDGYMIAELGLRCSPDRGGACVCRRRQCFTCAAGRAGGTVRPAAWAQGVTATAFGLLIAPARAIRHVGRTVARNSNSLKPMIFRSPDVGNHEGSMLLWLTILCLWGAVIVQNPARIR